MLVPLDYYRILGVPPTATEHIIVQAYQDRRVQLPRSEYSEAVVESRLFLLELAYQVLSDPQQRNRYQQQWLPLDTGSLAGGEVEGKPADGSQFAKTLPADRFDSEEAKVQVGRDAAPSEVPSRPLTLGGAPVVLDIPPEHWVGALVLLSEFGEYEQVIQQVEGNLITSPDETSHSFGSEIPSHHCNDIYLTLALAYLEISRDQWQHQQYEAAARSGMRGLARLKNLDILPGLQTEICTELDKLRPYRVLELLSNPQSPPVDRQQGMRLLQELLQQRRGIDGTGDDGSELDADNFLLFIQQLRNYLTVEEQLSLFAGEMHRPSPAASYLTAHALLARGCSQKQPEHIVEAYKHFTNLNFRQDSGLEKSVCALLLGQTDRALSYLRQYCGSEPPLLTGENSDSALQELCRIGETWLQTEIFPKFADLAHCHFSLQEYFSDRAVQSYLEQYVYFLDSFPVSEQEPIMAKPQPASYDESPYPRQRIRSSRRLSARESRGRLATRRAGTTVAERGSIADDRSFHLPQNSGAPANEVMESSRSRLVNYDNSGKVGSWRSGVRLAPRPTTINRSSRQKKSAIRVDRVVLLAAILLGGLGALGWSVKWAIDFFSPLTQLEKEQLFISIHKPVIETAPVSVSTTEREMTPENARQLLQTWLASKADAFGEKHQTGKLAEVLDESLLKSWKKRADNLAKINAFWQYRHDLEANSLKVDFSTPNQARIEAVVREKATYFQNGREQTSQSYDDTLRVRYSLVRRGDRWLIQSIQVLESL